MACITITPTDEHPVPYNDAKPEFDPVEDAAAAGQTAELQMLLLSGGSTDPQKLEEAFAELDANSRGVEQASFVSGGDTQQEQALIDKVLGGKASGKALENPGAALGALSFLRAYGAHRAHDAHEVRAALTNRLLEIADCEDYRHALKAIELLGKHKDVGLFTERSEINVNYNDPKDLELKIKERVKRLLNAGVVDVQPAHQTLDDMFGVVDIETVDVEDIEPNLPDPNDPPEAPAPRTEPELDGEDAAEPGEMDELEELRRLSHARGLQTTKEIAAAKNNERLPSAAKIDEQDVNTPVEDPLQDDHESR